VGRGERRVLSESVGSMELFLHSSPFEATITGLGLSVLRLCFGANKEDPAGKLLQPPNDYTSFQVQTKRVNKVKRNYKTILCVKEEMSRVGAIQLLHHMKEKIGHIIHYLQVVPTPNSFNKLFTQFKAPYTSSECKILNVISNQ
jgi:hypothetical protein